MKYLFCTLLYLIIFTSSSFSQTVGVLVSTDEALSGYTFFSPFSSNSSYMVDNCGRLINQWNRGTRPGLSAYFLENGQILRTYKVSPQGPFNSASNAGGLELVDWNNNIVWAYEFNTPTWLSHHDAVMMPNGNILMLTWEIIQDSELIELGRDPNEIAPQGYAWNERIVEIEPIGTNDINIIWEWRIKDHYIQDFDSTKSNFGEINEHPELFNINLPDINSSNSHSDVDYNHFNSIDYNEDLDQILISVRNSDEIWILDHSTTTEEAATHSGGNSNKGGDILYRWGNPSSYNRGTVADQLLFGQHGVHWIKDGLEDAGKILIYNNGNERPGQDYSQVQILVPIQETDGDYPVPTNDAFGPINLDWSYGDLGSNNFNSSFLSNAQRLPNGNTLINAGSPGNIFEINPAEEIVWQYEIPLNGNNPATQGSNPNNNGNFRAYKFAEDFQGFTDLDLSPGSTIEIDNNPQPCNLMSSVQNHISKDVELYFDVASNTLQFIQETSSSFEFQLIDQLGRFIYHGEGKDQIERFQIKSLTSGIHVVQMKFKGGYMTTKKMWIPATN